MGDPDAGRPHAYSATTDFERRSHAEMLKMVEDGNAVEVSRLGKKLLDAETTLNEIGGTLKTDMTRLDWDSEAGDAFRAWGHTIAKATESLADYSGTAGRFMEHAGTVLGEVQKAMPKVPSEAKKIADAHTLNPLLDTESVAGPRPGEGTVLAAGPTAKEIADARTEVDDARQQAAAQMTKLAQAYNMSTDILKSSEPPVFPPTPPEILPNAPRYADGAEFGAPSGSTTGAPSPYAAGVSGHAAAAAHAPIVGAEKPASVTDGRGMVAPQVNTQIDSVATVPSAPQTSGPAPGVPTSAVSSDGAPKAGLLLPGGTFGSTRGGGSGTPVPRVNGGTSPPRTPGMVSGTGLPRTPANDGIHGGRPVANAAPTSQIPRGAVVGNERGTGTVRPPMLGGGYGGGAVGGSGPVGPGRRLASEPGGVVGTPRRAGAPPGDAFTPGGSGLATRRGEQAACVHPTAGTGAAGAARGGVAASSDESNSRRGHRPDHLNEDAETWNSGGRNVVPPVIE